jgi:hypothetical protein
LILPQPLRFVGGVAGRVAPADAATTDRLRWYRELVAETYVGSQKTAIADKALARPSAQLREPARNRGRTFESDPAMAEAQHDHPDDAVRSPGTGSGAPSSLRSKRENPWQQDGSKRAREIS